MRNPKRRGKAVSAGKRPAQPAEPPPSDSGEAPLGVSPPVLDPDAFESYEGFRETTLAIFTDPEDNHALRRFGGLLSEMAWEYRRHWPGEPGGSFRHEVRACVADLRHLQGYLFKLGQEYEASDLTAEETCLGRFCGRLAVDVKNVADALERELAASLIP